MKAKFIYEYNFERGLDPKKAMEIGMPLDKIIKPGMILQYRGLVNGGNIPPRIIEILETEKELNNITLKYKLLSDTHNIEGFSTHYKGEINSWNMSTEFLNDNFKILKNYIPESLNFERGLDPKIAMGTGDIKSQARKLLQPYIEILKELKLEKRKDIKKITHIRFHSKDDKERPFTDIKDYYIEFRYGGNETIESVYGDRYVSTDSDYIQIGPNDDNIIEIPLTPLSHEKMKNLILSVLINY